MGNLIALLVHCQRGDEVIVGDKSHIYLWMRLAGWRRWEGSNRARFQIKPSTLALNDILASIRTEDVHHPITRLICIENTQNIRGGVPLTPEYTRQVGELARKNNLSLHIDGVRIFNAAAAQNVSVKELVESADSVMFCLSKGLVSPIGSMLVGTKQFIALARHLRKMLGGGMRFR